MLKTIAAAIAGMFMLITPALTEPFPPAPYNAGDLVLSGFACLDVNDILVPWYEDNEASNWSHTLPHVTEKAKKGECVLGVPLIMLIDDIQPIGFDWEGDATFLISAYNAGYMSNNGPVPMPMIGGGTIIVYFIAVSKTGVSL